MASTLDAGSASSNRRPITPGVRVGHYRVLHHLGAGGMGTVFSAEDPRLERRVALKLLHDDTTSGRLRLRREACAMAQLEHPNVVTIHDVGEHEGQVFVAMELVEGVDLRRWLRLTRREPEQILRAFLAAGRGLAAAHRAGVIHRDFKPSNVLVADDGRILVTDFGLAWLDTSAMSMNTGAEVLHESVTLELTQQGKVTGTPAFMAPEQWDALPTRAAADQFSFCVALYQALMGKHPFGLGSDLYLRVVEHRLRPATPPSPLAARLLPVLRRGLRPDPDRRWSSMDALLDALERASTRSPRRWRWALGGMVMLGTLCTLIATARTPPPLCAPPPREALWGPQRRASLHAHFVATRAPFAEAQWNNIDHQADRFIDRWRQDYQATCETAPAEVLDTRMACLRRGRARLDAAADVLGEADAGVIRRALEVLPHSAELRRCETDRAPKEPEAGSLHDHLAVALTLQRAGRYEEALATVTKVTALTRNLDAPDLQARIRLRKGSILDWLGRYDEAREELRAAFMLASAAGSDLVAVEAARLLGFVVGIRLVDHDDALDWVRHAAALARRAGAPDEYHAKIERVLGHLAQSRGELADAEHHYERALGLFEHAEAEIRDDLLARSLDDLGNVAFARGDRELALSYFQRAYARYALALPPSHPDLASFGENIGLVLTYLGDHRESERWLRDALALSRDALGPRHPATAKLHGSLGVVLARQGLHAESLGHYQRSAELSRERLGDAHPQTSRAYSNTGIALLRQGRPLEAIEMLRKALAGFEQQPEPNQAELASAAYNLAKGLLALGHHDDALPLLHRSLEIQYRETADASNLAVTEALYLHTRSLASADVVEAWPHPEPIEP